MNYFNRNKAGAVQIYTFCEENLVTHPALREGGRNKSDKF